MLYFFYFQLNKCFSARTNKMWKQNLSLMLDGRKTPGIPAVLTLPGVPWWYCRGKGFEFSTNNRTEEVVRQKQSIAQWMLLCINVVPAQIINKFIIYGSSSGTRCFKHHKNGRNIISPTVTIFQNWCWRC